MGGGSGALPGAGPGGAVLTVAELLATAEVVEPFNDQPGKSGATLFRVRRGDERFVLKYLDPARDRPNLTLVADTLVDRVLLAGDRAIGVATAAGDLRAGAVVLAAGAYGSPGVLLRSGVGPQRGLPVGEGLSDHVGVGFGFQGTDRLQREVAAPA